MKRDEKIWLLGLYQQANMQCFTAGLINEPMNSLVFYHVCVPNALECFYTADVPRDCDDLAQMLYI